MGTIFCPTAANAAAYLLAGSKADVFKYIFEVKHLPVSRFDRGLEEEGGASSHVEVSIRTVRRPSAQKQEE
jgi:hypothetical protein